MIAFYNFGQLLLLLFSWPALIVLILLKAKFRKGIPKRLGRGLQRQLSPILPGQKTVWIHALSVGEVSSAHPLVAGLRRKYPHLRIIFSASTITGLQVAGTLLAPLVDSIIPSPLDIRPIVERYIRLIQPDLFILVETDFWPNLLNGLRSNTIPAILVNGRISQKSLASYRKYAFFFRPLFQSFAILCMQTDRDCMNMTHFGVKTDLLHHPGNLKFDTSNLASPPYLQELAHYIPRNKRVFLAGSTHKGEEEIILAVYGKMQEIFSDLFLVLAPRDPERRAEIGQIASAHNLSWQYRSGKQGGSADLLILDTLGELPGLYSFAHVAFIGGSLVDEGGHNPIEPASAGIPVLFGRHMEDFAEIRQELLQSGGGIEIGDQTSLQQTLTSLFSSEERRKKIGNLALTCILSQCGVVDRHLEIIGKYL